MDGQRLILPGDLEYERTLASIPPDWRNVAEKTNGSFAFVADHETRLLKAVNGQDFREYVLGGEYEEVVGEEFFLEEELGEIDEFYVDV
jgi:hypothetical protein